MSGEKLIGYIAAAGKAIDLEIPEECLAGVAENLARNFEMARPLLAFSLREEEESAPIFKP